MIVSTALDRSMQEQSLAPQARVEQSDSHLERIILAGDEWSARKQLMLGNPGRSRQQLSSHRSDIPVEFVSHVGGPGLDQSRVDIRWSFEGHAQFLVAGIRFRSCDDQIAPLNTGLRCRELLAALAR